MPDSRQSASSAIRFGPFDADVHTQELRKHGVRLRLPGQSFQVLKMLLERPGTLVTREELRQALWPSDTFVDFDHGVSAAVNRLREAIGDSADEPQLIETLPRRGYRFIGTIAPPAAEAPSVISIEAGPAGAAAERRPAVVSRWTEYHREWPHEVPRKGRYLWRALGFGVMSLTVVAVGIALWLRNSHRPTDRSQWVALTKLPDPVSQPALSADGRMLVFIRGDSTFIGPAQVYVKMLPDGQPVQLTHDSLYKMNPVFSPDGARIAYTAVTPKFEWDTWVVPTLGGEPQPWLRNASGLVWTGPGRLLFAEMRKSPHMGIVTAAESRIGERDVYLPAAETAMAHRSSASPDGKSVLLVEMNKDHEWTPCRLVPMDGTSAGRQVGPPKSACTSAAWSPDGRWMYVASEAGGLFHIWRQRFPDGRPQQMTSGPTEEEGIAMAPDGRSFVTAVTLQSVSVWIHDVRGTRQVSLEGNAAEPKFTPDGRKLCYRILLKAPNNFQFSREEGPVWLADLDSGRSSPLVSDFPVLAYDISQDGRQVVLEAEDQEGKPRLWLTTFERQLPPQPIPNVEGRQPSFGPGNEIFFYGADSFVYRVRTDGTGLRKALEIPILTLADVSPDGRWLAGWSRLADGETAFQAFPLGGGPPVRVGDRAYWQWSPSANSVSITRIPGAEGQSYIVPLPPGQALPAIPAGGFRSEQDVARLQGARKTDALMAVPGPRPDVYAFYRSTKQRNLYRIPIS
jgi:DNA-binding winged helix-turn-helix (wHTH) protein/Tol biopolymer transport system component